MHVRTLLRPCYRKRGMPCHLPITRTKNDDPIRILARKPIRVCRNHYSTTLSGFGFAGGGFSIRRCGVCSVRATYVFVICAGGGILSHIVGEDGTPH